jgi:hypothetical protein
VDAHTHLTGQENAEQLLECMDICGVEKAFVFAPMLNVQALGEGSPAREEYRDMIFYRNALDHWQNAIREPQRPQATQRAIETTRAYQGHG